MKNSIKLKCGLFLVAMLVFSVIIWVVSVKNVAGVFALTLKYPGGHSYQYNVKQLESSGTIGSRGIASVFTDLIKGHIFESLIQNGSLEQPKFDAMQVELIETNGYIEVRCIPYNKADNSIPFDNEKRFIWKYGRLEKL